jgi:hypothetical protein
MVMGKGGEAVATHTTITGVRQCYSTINKQRVAMGGRCSNQQTEGHDER